MKELPQIGWREWLALPELNIPGIRCKIDTGARTSAIHATNIEADAERGLVRFQIQPLRKQPDLRIFCVSPIVDQRIVTNSGGQKQYRYVIESTAKLAGNIWPIQITLTDRAEMRFPMLLGRTALKNQFVVNSAKSFLYGKPKRNIYIKQKGDSE